MANHHSIYRLGFISDIILFAKVSDTGWYGTTSFPCSRNRNTESTACLMLFYQLRGVGGFFKLSILLIRSVYSDRSLVMIEGAITIVVDEQILCVPTTSHLVEVIQ